MDKIKLILKAELLDRGSILVITLWSLCLLAFFAVYTGYLSRQKIVFMQRMSSRDDLHFIAEAGVKSAIAQIDKDQDTDVDSLKDPWSNNIEAFRDIQVGNGKFSVSYDYMDSLSSRMQKRLGIVDEEGKININRAGADVLSRLFGFLGIEQAQANDLAFSILDWRDPDSFLSDPLAGAEDSYYSALGQPYECKDAPFESLSELMLVKGITWDVFAKIKDYITVYGNGRVNINTCSIPVLFGLGIDEVLIDKIIVFRYGKDEVISTDDDGVFTEASAMAVELAKSAPLSDTELAWFNDFASSGAVTVNSKHFTIRSSAVLDNWRDKPGHQIICVVKRTGEVLSYDEF